MASGPFTRGVYGHAVYRGHSGAIVARLSVPGRNRQTNVLWKPDGRDTEIMFSLRADDEWRAFPGPADGHVLEIVDGPYA